MSDHKAVGKNYAVIQGTALFFGASGAVLASLGEGTWAVQGHEQNGAQTLSNVMGVVREGVARCVAGGNGGQIARLVVEPVYAVILFLGDVITMQHMVHAHEGEGFVRIPGITIDDHTFDVIVLARPTEPVAFADSKGRRL